MVNSKLQPETCPTADARQNAQRINSHAGGPENVIPR